MPPPLAGIWARASTMLGSIRSGPGFTASPIQGARPSIARAGWPDLRTHRRETRSSIPASRSLHRPPCSPGKPPRFPGREKPSQFRSVSEAIRGLRTEFRPFSRILRLKSPASLYPQNSVSRPTHRDEGHAVRVEQLDQLGEVGERPQPHSGGEVRLK